MPPHDMQDWAPDALFYEAGAGNSLHCMRHLSEALQCEQISCRYAQVLGCMPRGSVLACAVKSSCIDAGFPSGAPVGAKFHIPMVGFQVVGHYGSFFLQQAGSPSAMSLIPSFPLTVWIKDPMVSLHVDQLLNVDACVVMLYCGNHRECSL